MKGWFSFNNVFFSNSTHDSNFSFFIWYKLWAFISYNCLINHYIIYKDNNGVRKKQILRNDIGRVKENLKTNNESYISGSSIKGSIKNAILYSELDLKNDTNNEARKSINGTRFKKIW